MYIGSIISECNLIVRIMEKLEIYYPVNSIQESLNKTLKP